MTCNVHNFKYLWNVNVLTETKKVLKRISMFISIDKLECIKYFVKIIDSKNKISAGYLLSAENSL